MTHTELAPLAFFEAVEHRRKIAFATNQVIHGHINSVGTVTLTANQATTTLADNFVHEGSKILLSPLTDTAAAEIAGTSLSDKYWTFGSPAGTTGTFYSGGFYMHAGASNTFAGGPTFGTANSSYAAHFFVVLGAVTVDELTLRVTGTSINDSATRTTADTQDIVIPNATAIDTYFETSKKWLGTVTITVVSGTATICDYGYSKYWDFGNRDFRVMGVEATWLAGANDSGADIQLAHHKSTGWTYTGTGATPPTAIASMVTDHVTENNVINGENGAWKRTDLSVDVAGSASEGILFLVITTANRAFELGNLQVQIAAGPSETIYISSTGENTATITHADSAVTDRTFGYVVLG